MDEDSKNGIQVYQKLKYNMINSNINNSKSINNNNHQASKNRASMIEMWSDRSWFSLQVKKLLNFLKYSLSKKIT